MSTADRLRKLEDRLGVGVCPRCTELPRLSVRFDWKDHEDDRTTAGTGICPECGKPEPERLVIVFAERSDGPQ